MLTTIARHGKLFLAAGLLAGALLPDVARLLRPWLGEMVAVLLLLNAMRIGAREAFGGTDALLRMGGVVVVYQLVLPLLAFGLFTLTGVLSHPFALAVVLMLAAPAVTGSLNFTILSGHDPAPAMRLLVMGTALFPLTVLPVLWLLPQLGDAGPAALRLIATILCAVGLGFALRWVVRVDEIRKGQIDGLSTLLLMVVVVGLMAGVGPLLTEDPWRLGLWVLGVIAVNLGLQIIALLGLTRANIRAAVPLSIIAGNRNIALFFVALSDEVTAPLLIFIGCYQIPMYLTPILMKPLHARFADHLKGQSASG